MATTIKRIGFGQVEPNHLSAQGNRQIYAQLPLKSNINILENGQFMKYDYANNEVNLTGDGEYMLVFNEVKVYDERETYKDFAMIKKNYVGGEIYGDKLKVDTATGYLVKDNAVSTGMIWKVVKEYTMPDGQPGVKLQRIN